MEDLLLNLVKEASGAKSVTIRQSAQEAHGEISEKLCICLMVQCFLRFAVCSE